MNTYLNEEERKALERVRVGIAGAGGLGSNCAQHLVRAGVKNLVICDFDVVNESNLNRQFFFRDQLGMKKVDALSDNLRRINPELNLTIHDIELNGASAKEKFAECDIIVEALDSIEAKTMLLSAILPMKKPLVMASGLAGWGKSSELGIRRIGERLIVVGDETREVGENASPQSPRVGIVAAMQANCVISLILGHDI